MLSEFVYLILLVVFWKNNPRIHLWVVARKGASINGVVVVCLRVVVTDDGWRISTTLDVDQQRCVLHKSLFDLLLSCKCVHNCLLFHSCQVSPVTLIKIINRFLLRVLNLWCVGHSYLVTLEYLRSATLLATGPGAVTLPISQAVICHLNWDSGLTSADEKHE